MTNDTTTDVASRIPDRYDALREDAAHYAASVCEQEFPRLYERFGAAGREHCRADIAFHLDFLRAALIADDTAPFFAYLGWLSQVLTARGVPMDSVPRSLEALAEYYRDAMGRDADPVVSILQAGVRALARDIEPVQYDRPCPTPWQEAESFRDAALTGDRRAAAHSFNTALDRAGSLPKAGLHVIQPALYDIGRLWQENRVSVAQEHLATALAQTLLAQGFGRFEPREGNGRRALFACVDGNQHTLGLRMVADTFELAGWTVHFLGASTPLRSLLQHVESFRPDLVGLSAALPFHLRALRDAVAAIRAGDPEDRIRITAGGIVLNQFPPLAASLGVELLGTDALQALELVNSRPAAP